MNFQLLLMTILITSSNPIEDKAFARQCFLTDDHNCIMSAWHLYKDDSNFFNRQFIDELRYSFYKEDLTPNRRYYFILALNKWGGLEVCNYICNNKYDLYNYNFYSFVELSIENDCKCNLQLISNADNKIPYELNRGQLMYYKIQLGAIKSEEEIANNINDPDYKTWIIMGIEKSPYKSFELTLIELMKDEDSITRSNALAVYNRRKYNNRLKINEMFLYDENEINVEFGLYYLSADTKNRVPKEIVYKHSKLLELKNEKIVRQFIKMLDNSSLSKDEKKKLLIKYNTDCNKVCGDANRICYEIMK